MSLQNQLTAMSAEQQQQQQSQQQQQAAAGSTVPEEEVRQLRVRLEAAELAVQTVQRAHTEAVERAMMSQQEHQRHLERLSEDHAARLVELRARAEEEAEARWRARCQEAEAALRAAREQAAALQRECEALRAVSFEWRPEAREFVELERRIAQMEAAGRDKEERWRQVLEEARRVHSLQQSLLRQRMELTVEAKNREIERFKGELDALLAAAAMLRGEGPAAAALVAV
jgi:hypothetical protein